MIIIAKANLRDASWITHNLRRPDRQEVLCQLPEDTHHATLAGWLLQTGDAFVAYDRNEPVLLFGTSPMHVSAMSVWAMGTEGMERAVPEVSRYLIRKHIPDRIDQGFNNMEARSLVTHDSAHRWIESMGGVRYGEPYLYGRNGEHFVTFRWTVSSYRAISDGRWAEAVPKERVTP